MEDYGFSVSIILPVYNEENNLAELIKRIRKVGPDFEIIVIDDGSEDSTQEIANAAQVKVIRHPYNRGNGAAIKTGVKEAKGEVLVMMDSDMQHPPEEIPRLLEFFPKYDMAVAARGKNADVSKFRGLGNFLLKKTAELLSGHNISDLTSGFRAIKRDKITEFVHLFPERYSYPTTITIAMFKAGYFVKYLHLDTIQKRREGKSQLKPFKDGFRFIAIMLRIIMLFDPQKIFFPASLILLFLGGAFACYTIFFFASIRNLSVTMFICGIFTFLFGLLAEQVSLLRRDLKR